jgi:hypothetical protein
MIEVLVNATVVYNDGVKERFDAILVTKKRIITGKIFKKNQTEEFQEYGYIPKLNIKHIYNGSKKKIQRMHS